MSESLIFVGLLIWNYKPSRQIAIESQKNNIRTTTGRCSNVILLTFNLILPARRFSSSFLWFRMNSHFEKLALLLNGLILVNLLCHLQIAHGDKRMCELFQSRFFFWLSTGVCGRPNISCTFLQASCNVLNYPLG